MKEGKVPGPTSVKETSKEKVEARYTELSLNDMKKKVPPKADLESFQIELEGLKYDS